MSCCCGHAVHEHADNRPKACGIEDCDCLDYHEPNYRATPSPTAGLDRESVARALHLTNDQDTWQWGEWTTDEYGLEFYRNWADRFLAAARERGEK